MNATSAPEPGLRWRSAALGRTVLFVWLTAAALLAVTWMHTFMLIEASRVSKEELAIRDLSNLARVSEEHASRTLRSTDQVVRFVKDRYLERGPAIDLLALSERGVLDNDIFNQIGVIDANGIYAHANRPITSRLDLSDREHFRFHVTRDLGELFVSKPVIGRATQRWSLQLTRRIDLAGGAFGGVVVISVDTEYFTRFYGELQLGDRGVAALYGLDGIARARRVGLAESHGVNAVSSQMFRMIEAGQSSGHYRSRSVIDGVDRLYSYRKLADFPLVVVVGRDVSDVFLAHNRDKEGFVLQAGVVSALLLLLALAFTRHFLHMRNALEQQEVTQAQVAERTAELNAVFSLSPDGLLTFDENHRVKYVSPAVQELLGTLGLNLTGLDEREFLAWLSGRCEPGAPRPLVFAGDVIGPPGTRQVLSLASPAKRVLEVSSRTVDVPSVSRILYLRDITHETEVARIKSEFLSTAAHELRTPMASIYGFSEVLETQPELDPATRQEFLGIIHQQSRNVAAILDELLDLSRIEARQGKNFKLAPLDALQWVTDTLKAFKLPEGRQPATVSLPDGPVWITGDISKLRQVLQNVLSNAYKYSPDGGGVTVGLVVLAEAQPLQLELRVTDKGIGMTPKEVKRVFERFFRADTSGKLPGTGLGMSIVQEIMRFHHGTVEVHSTWGVGTTVVIRLPVDGGSAQLQTA